MERLGAVERRYSHIQISQSSALNVPEISFPPICVEAKFETSWTLAARTYAPIRMLLAHICSRNLRSLHILQVTLFVNYCMPNLFLQRHFEPIANLSNSAFLSVDKRPIIANVVAVSSISNRRCKKVKRDEHKFRATAWPLLGLVSACTDSSAAVAFSMKPQQVFHVRATSSCQAQRLISLKGVKHPGPA